MNSAYPLLVTSLGMENPLLVFQGKPWEIIPAVGGYSIAMVDSQRVVLVGGDKTSPKNRFMNQLSQLLRKTINVQNHQ